MLINQGAKCNIKDARGNTPLHYCCLNGHSDPAKILINVSVTILNNKGIVYAVLEFSIFSRGAKLPLT